MNCDHVLELVQQSLDREGRILLPTGGARHLEECGDCRQAAEHLQRIHDALAQSAPSAEEHPSRDFHQRFLTRLAEEPAHVPGTHEQRLGRKLGRGRMPGARGAAVAGVAAVAAVLVLVLALRVPSRSESGAVAGISNPVPGTAGIPVHTDPAGIPEEELSPVETTLEVVENLELEAIVTAPHQVYASVGAGVSGLTRGFFEATASLHRSLTSDPIEPQAHP